MKNVKVGHCTFTPVFKARDYGLQRVKLEYDKRLASFAFSFNWRRYMKAAIKANLLQISEGQWRGSLHTHHVPVHVRLIFTFSVRLKHLQGVNQVEPGTKRLKLSCETRKVVRP